MGTGMGMGMMGMGMGKGAGTGTDTGTAGYIIGFKGFMGNCPGWAIALRERVCVFF